MCNHDLVVKDSYADGKPCKLTICKLCNEVTNISVRGEVVKPKTVWDAKDERISRMSAIKTAAEINVATMCLTPHKEFVEKTFDLANEIVNWIYGGQNDTNG
jgi:regulation of enolase protein 1 (concanavalin A-like superfamily)